MHHIIFKSGLVGLGYFTALILDEKTGVPLAAAIAIAGAWGSGLWWLGRKLQTLEDGQTLMKLQYQHVMKRIDNLSCNRGDPPDTCLK